MLLEFQRCCRSFNHLTKKLLHRYKSDPPAVTMLAALMHSAAAIGSKAAIGVVNEVAY